MSIPIEVALAFPEVRGVHRGRGQVWALIFGECSVREEREVKIAWRMTGGDGPLNAYATGPDGRRVTPL